MITNELFNKMVDFIRQQPWDRAAPLMAEIQKAISEVNQKQHRQTLEDLKKKASKKVDSSTRKIADKKSIDKAT